MDSPRAVQFRKWANQIIEEFTVKGFAMDDERLKNGGTVLTKDYFREQLERIREIRLSERRFYQKITDIYATSIDYDSKAVSYTHLDELYFKPEYRGKGYGTQAFAWVEQEYPDAKRFRLEATYSNERAISLYRKLGYEELNYCQMIKDRK